MLQIYQVCHMLDVKKDTCHIYHEANNIINWMIFYMTEHIWRIAWTDTVSLSLVFYDIYFFNFFGCIYIRTV